MRVTLCSVCRSAVTAKDVCHDCAEIAKLMQPAAGALVLPFAVLRRMTPKARRAVVAAISRARRG